MTEPVSSAIGVKFASLVAGFAGGVVSLAFLRNLTRAQAAMSVIVGALSAAYLTPVAIVYIGWTNRPELQNGMAFVIGLTAMNVIPALKAGAARWLLKSQPGDGTKS